MKAKEIAEMGDILYMNGIKAALKFEGNRTIVAHKNYKVLIVHDVKANVIYTRF
ncbi:DUF2187 family protein [Bacillus sp. ISL-46]|nr:DUF2187 family protein [Bacillus sp. ISL-46]